MEKVFLLPGEYHVTRSPSMIATLLGSCVSVCISHIAKPYAGMNHFLLAHNPGADSDKGRYGNSSTETVIWLLSKLDPDMHAYRAKIFGGGKVVGHLGAQSDIGTKNIEMAREVLKKHGIKLVEEEVGGTNGRRIYFNTVTKNVEVKVIQKTEETEKLESKRRDLATRAIRVLVVDDSPLVRRILRQAIESANDIEVCGEAGDPYEARDMILETDPDVISLDIIMPRMDGLQFLKNLSKHYPKPVVICSTIAKDKSDISKKAVQYGAVDVVDKEKLELYKGLEVVKQAYIPKLKLAATKVVRKRIFED